MDRSLRRAQAAAFSQRATTGPAVVTLCSATAPATPVAANEDPRRRRSPRLQVVVAHAPALEAPSAPTTPPASAEPTVAVVDADAQDLPVASRSCGGVWSDTGVVDVASEDLPIVLAEIHRVLRPGAQADLRLAHLDELDGLDGLDGEDGGPGSTVAAIVTGAGFEILAAQPLRSGWRLRLEAVPTLADSVAPGMALLLVGLNPSPAAADLGIPYAGRSNRFWAAVTAAGLLDRPRDLRRALRVQGVGFTDLAKRVTASAEEIGPGEFRAGVARLERLVRWAKPELVCFVGLAGWRAAVDRRARPGLVDRRIGDRPCYLMPSTSGLNAHVRLADLVDHVTTVGRLAGIIR